MLSEMVMTAATAADVTIDSYSAPTNPPSLIISQKGGLVNYQPVRLVLPFYAKAAFSSG
jgi:hypothetical protein